MKKLLWIALFTSVSQTAWAVTTIKAEVNGMVCAFCAKGIEKKLNALPQKQAAYVDLQSRIVALQLKDGQEVSDERFKQIIQDAGYSVGKLERVSDSVEDIKQRLNNKERK